MKEDSAIDHLTVEKKFQNALVGEQASTKLANP
jgi:hypothetical protein